MPPRAGFTLVELVATLAIASILVAVAAPAFGNLIKDTRLSTTTNDFLGVLQLTRSQAIRSQHYTILCKSPSGSECDDAAGWNEGWIAFEDRNRDRHCQDANGDLRCDLDNGLIFLSRAALPTSFSMKASGNASKRMRFGPGGDTAGYMTTFILCDDRGDSEARGVKIAITGRARVVGKEEQLSCG
jgi:type IV fimbrial biogenesis protein FimT